jgi:hypothetical protein
MKRTQFLFLIASVVVLVPSIAFAQNTNLQGAPRTKSQHEIAKRCAISAGMPIAKDGSWNDGSPEALYKYRACKAKNNIN